MPFTNRATLFAIENHRAFEMDEADIPALQTFFEKNPAYYLIVSGEPPKADEAREEILGPLPDGWPYTRKWIIGLADDAGTLCGIANIVSDLLAPTVWHIGFFLIATPRHGSGASRAIYGALESWMRGQGARWLRLGVVEGNVRAERFWKRCGFVEVRKRAGIAMGQRVNTVSVQVKPLAGGTIGDYLAMIERDRPDQP